MKSLFVIFILLLNTFFVSGQSIYLDALKLSEISHSVDPGKKYVEFEIDTSNKDAFCQIMKNYGLNISKTGSELKNEIQNFLGENPFILVSSSLQEGQNWKNNVYKGDKSMFGKFNSSIGGLNVTNAADGLAKFLVERTKQELSIYFFERLKTELDTIPELRTLFPTSHQVLLSIDSEIYLLEAYLNTLREAFSKDLSNLYNGVQQLAQVKKYKDRLDENPKLRTTFFSSFYLIDRLSKGYHPGQMLAGFDTTLINFQNKNGSNEFVKLQHNLRNSIALTSLISESFRANSSDRYWVSEGELLQLFKNEKLFTIYLGLLFQKSFGISFYSSNNSGTKSNTLTTFSSILIKLKNTTNAAQDSIALYKNFIRSLHYKCQSAEEYLAALKQENSGKNFTDYYQFYNSTLEIFSTGIEFLDLPFVEIEEEEYVKKQTQRWIFTAHIAGELFADVRTQHYSRAVLSTITLLDTLNCGNEVLLNKIMKYGTFAANVAEAKSSDEVKAAIETIALPAGSSRIKRETAVNISVNSYVGMFMGQEDIIDLAGDTKKTINAYGVTAPVGIAVSKGFRAFHQRWSASLMFSVIDVGTLVSYRFQNDSTSEVPEIKLAHIFSPGTFISLGLPKCPLSLNFGCQVGPNLRKIYATSASNEVQESMYLRWSASVNVDIPLMNLYTKSKR